MSYPNMIFSQSCSTTNTSCIQADRAISRARSIAHCERQNQDANLSRRVMIERIFGLQKAQTNLQREISGGLATFMTMAYIIFVQPAVLGAAGMDPGAVMVATCLATAFATFLMAFLANYPIAQAPAMGHNFFFAYTVVLTLHYSWQQALGAIFISGLLFIALSFVGLRERLVNSIPATLKNGIAAGIGLLIAVVGLEWAGIVVHNPGTLGGYGKVIFTAGAFVTSWVDRHGDFVNPGGAQRNFGREFW